MTNISRFGDDTSVERCQLINFAVVIASTEHRLASMLLIVSLWRVPDFERYPRPVSKIYTMKFWTSTIY